MIVGHLIPAGTGVRDYSDLIVYQEREYNSLLADNKEKKDDDYVAELDAAEKIKKSDVTK